MTDRNLILFVASYSDAAAAEADYNALKDAQAAEDFAVVQSVVLSRGEDGTVKVDEHGATAVGGGAILGAGAGLVIGLFAPPLLLATAVGAGIGAIVGEFVKKHEERKLGVDLEEYLPVGSSALVAIVDDMYADRVDKAVTKATKRVSKAIDSGDYEKIQKALDEGTDTIVDAVES